MTVPIEVTLWAACPDEAAGEADEPLRACLGVPERARLARLKDEDARRQYLVAHVLLRQALSSVSAVSPTDWRFGATRLGRPFIRRPKVSAPLFFSLSHTRSLAVCAVSSHANVGVDAEMVRGDIELDALGRHVLEDGELSWWQSGPAESRLADFYRFWTLKEALLKGLGCGLSAPLTGVAFDLGRAGAPRLRRLPSGCGGEKAWSFRLLEPTLGHVCALAVNVGPEGPLNVHMRRASVAELRVAAGRGR